MSKGLHSHYLDFEVIPTGNSKVIVFLDCSDYFKQPDSPSLEITVPGYNVPFTVPIEFSKANTFNTNTLGITSRLNGSTPVDLPDGIYTYKLKIQPYNVLYRIKNFLKTDILDSLLEKVYSSVECTTDIIDNPQLKRELVDIHILLESAKANATYCNLDKSKKDYSLALKKVEKLHKNIKNV